MANSTLFQFRYSYERDLTDIVLKCSIGASGAPTMINRKGITSITRNSAGLYTIVLKDNFNLLMNANIMQLDNDALAAPITQIVSETVSSTKTVVVQFRDIALAAADPNDGAVVMIHLCLRNAST